MSSIDHSSSYIIYKRLLPYLFHHELIPHVWIDFFLVFSVNSTLSEQMDENYVTSEGAVSHNVLYHQPVPISSPSKVLC